MSVKDMRLKAGLNQTDFAKKLLLPLDTLKDWESGNNVDGGCPTYIKFLIYNFLFKRSMEVKK